MPDTERAYLACGSDYAVPPDWQRHVARTELGVRAIELDSGHSPMLSCPGDLADILDRIASGKLASFAR